MNVTAEQVEAIKTRMAEIIVMLEGPSDDEEGEKDDPYLMSRGDIESWMTEAADALRELITQVEAWGA